MQVLLVSNIPKFKTNSSIERQKLHHDLFDTASYIEVYTFVNTIHTHCVIRVALGKQLHIKAALKLNRSTKDQKKLYLRHVSPLKSKFPPVSIDPFSTRQLRCVTTGKQKRVTEYDICFHQGNNLFLCFFNKGSLRVHSFLPPIDKVSLNKERHVFSFNC